MINQQEKVFILLKLNIAIDNLKKKFFSKIETKLNEAKFINKNLFQINILITSFAQRTTEAMKNIAIRNATHILAKYFVKNLIPDSNRSVAFGSELEHNPESKRT
jgi:hypothetical protein